MMARIFMLLPWNWVSNTIVTDSGKAVKAGAGMGRER
jgi:hypothetical protein